MVITKKSIRDSIKARHHNLQDEEHKMIVNCICENEKEYCETQKEYIHRIFDILNQHL